LRRRWRRKEEGVRTAEGIINKTGKREIVGRGRKVAKSNGAGNLRLSRCRPTERMKGVWGGTLSQYCCSVTGNE